MGHASPSTTLNMYAHMFDEARHTADIRARMARTAFAGLLENDKDERRVITLPDVARGTHERSPPASGPRSSGQLDQNLTKPGQVVSNTVTPQPDSSRFAGTSRWS